MPGGHASDLYINGNKVPVDFRQLQVGDTLHQGAARFDSDGKFIGHELLVTRDVNSSPKIQPKRTLFSRAVNFFLRQS